MKALTLNEYEVMKKHHARVVVFEEIAFDALEIGSVYETLCDYFQQEGFVFETPDEEGHGEYVHLSFVPIQTTEIFDVKIDCVSQLRNDFLKFDCGVREDVSHHVTAAMGFFSYDASFSMTAERVETSGFPLCFFQFCSFNMTVDVQKKKAFLSVVAEKDGYEQAKEKLETIKKQIRMSKNLNRSLPPFGHLPPQGKGVLMSDGDTSDEAFIKKVEQAKAYIRQGDAFQIVLSRTFKRPCTVTPFQLYNTVRSSDPCNYLFHFPANDCTIVGASPERFIRVKNGEITMNPIAGTRKRTEQTLFKELENDLLSDQKERAEHVMLVDLTRNDVGRVSETGSVRVSDFLKVKHYQHISHITSLVNGKIKANHDAFDALKAAFPAGTLSGAPKIRAMEIIQELEQTPRQLYGGAICRLDVNGDLESAIAIRMAIVKNNEAVVRAGCGVVFDSVPEKEAEETRQKAYSIFSALSKAHGETA